METRAITKYVRISAFKAREIARLIQDKSVNEALAFLSLSNRKASRIIDKTLRSAIANAENDPDNHVTRDDLYVKEAIIGEGPTMKRFRTKARGMAGRIRRRTSHVRIVVASY